VTPFLPCDESLATVCPNVELPEPIDQSIDGLIDAFPNTAAVNSIREWLSCHDGTGELSIIPMASDVSYFLLSYRDALQELESIRFVFENELSVDHDSNWWSDNWWPVGSNGAGDLLVVDCGNTKLKGAVLCFSHETRRHVVRAKSILAMFQDLATGLLEGKYEYRESDNCFV
jgi:cell wall assembly regulator SMI1